MKKIINLISILLVVALGFSACQKVDNMVEHPEFVLSTIPITVGDNMVADTLSTLGESLQTTLDYTYFQYSLSANKNNEVTAAQKLLVNSNLSWRIEPAEEDQDWARPFPDRGEGAGFLHFFTERNNSQELEREAFFNVILNDGMNDIPVPGMLIIKQAPAVDFMKASVANIEINANDASNKYITLSSNIDWEYELVPDPQYATEDVEWFTDLTEEVEQIEGSIDTKLKFKATDNSAGSIRGAILKITVPTKPDFNREIPIVQFGADVEVTGFPVQWIIGIGPENINFNETFPAGYINATEGGGRIEYYSDPAKPDVDGKFKRLVGGGGDPYVTGAWPGDYWRFTSSSPVSAGTILKISFQAATSATGHKFWRMEYRDGDEWIVPESLKKVTDEPGYEVVYTHTMKTSSSSKVDVSATVKLNNTTDAADFRFVCAANWQSQGGALPAPNGGTVRLSLSNTASMDWQPSIKCVAAGSENLTPANIQISGIEDDLIAFEGAPEEPVSFKVTSDMNFEVTADVPWLQIENGSGLELEEKTVTVTCLPSDLTTMRRAKIEVKSGITKKYINVIQSAAGGDLEPFISLVGGNSVFVDGRDGSINLKVQSNIPYTVKSDVDWLVYEPVPAVASVPEVTTVGFTKVANKTGLQRQGNIIIENEEYNMRTVLTVTQDILSILIGEWSFAHEDDLVLGEDFMDGDDMWLKSDDKKSIIKPYLDVPSSKPMTYSYQPDNNRMLTYSFANNDYWLFTMPVKDLPMGDVNVQYYTCSSQYGAKFFILEWSTDNATWTQVNTQTETYLDQSVTYTYTVDYNSKSGALADLTKVNETFSLPALAGDQTLYIRARVSSAVRSDLKGTMAPGHGSTHRMCHKASVILFEK